MVLRILILTVISLATPVLAQTPDERFLEGLRARRLFRLAEQFCAEQVRRSELSETKRAKLLIELARTYADHALHSPPHERPGRWNEAHQVVADFRIAYPDSPRMLLVRLQDALTWLAQGELARQEAQIGASAQEPRLDAARASLRRAANELEMLAEQVETLLRQRLRHAPHDPAELTATELAALEKNIDYQRARVYRNQAECYPPASPDRANSLTQAIEQLAPLAELTVADEMVWRARIERVVCLRLLGDERQATLALAALVDAEPPPAIALRAQAEKIRLRLADERLDEALQAVAQGRAAAGQTSPELDLAHLEALVAAWQAASDREDATQHDAYQRQAAAQVQQIERAHGPYWMRRAEMLLGRSVSSGAGGDVEALARAAASFYRSSQIGEALATYDRAVVQAREQGLSDRAFELAFTAASIEHDREQHAEATRRFQQLAQTQPTHPRASEAHLLALLHMAELARQSTGENRAAWLERYRRALEEQLQQWPQAAATDRARVWLGDLRRSQHDWAGATAVYNEVARDHPQYEAAVRALADAYDRWLAALQADGKPREQVAADAAAQLLAKISPADPAAPASFTQFDRFCALAAAKIQLEHQNNPAAAERVLTHALDRSPDPPSAWRSEAAILLVYALAAQGRTDAAARVMDQISGGDPGGLVTLLAALTELSAAAQPDSRRALAELQLRTVALLEPRQNELPTAMRKAFDKGRATALAAAGRTAEALQAYNELAEQHPLDGQIQQARAELLQATNDPATLRQALEQWRAIERHSRRGGERWFAARYAQAEAHYRLGDKAQAAKLIKLTAVLHPELGGAAQRAKFNRLLDLCK